MFLLIRRAPKSNESALSAPQKFCSDSGDVFLEYGSAFWLRREQVGLVAGIKFQSVTLPGKELRSVYFEATSIHSL